MGNTSPVWKYLVLLVIMVGMGYAYIASRDLGLIARAWVDVEVINASISWYKDGSVGVTVHLSEINSGSSPAHKVTTVVDLTTMFPSINAKHEDIQKICRPNENMATFHSDLIFKKQENIVQYGYLSKEKVDDYKRKMFQIDNDFQYVPLSLVVCAVYRIVNDSQWHHTAKIFSLEKLKMDSEDQNRQRKFPAPLSKIGENLAEKELAILPYEDLDFFD